MADRYLKATGNWNNNATWSATDGGAAGVSFPTSADNAYITANGNGLTLTVNVSSSCLDLICSGGSTATLAGSSGLNVFATLTLLSTMTISYSSTVSFYSTGSETVTCGQTLNCGFDFYGTGGTFTLQDEVNLTAQIFAVDKGTLVTNNNNITCGQFISDHAFAAVMTLGSSTVTCTTWEMARAVTVNAGTSTIKVSGTGVFTGFGQTYNDVELNGTAHT
ncbi:hypothetical protein LCGC14_3130670, partial [marine sediment metagenome]